MSKSPPSITGKTQKPSSDAGCFQFDPDTSTWQDTLDDNSSGIYSETPIGQLLHDLTAYAEYGIVLAPSRDANQGRQFLHHQVNRAQDLLEILPTRQWALEDENLKRLIVKSKARWNVDNGKPITAKELSILSGHSLQTIKNKLAGKTREIAGNQNHIEGREALAWLSVQRHFKLSIWQQQDDMEAIEASDRGLGKVLFLPVAKDGSVFHPGVRRDGKYLVDGEGRVKEISTLSDVSTGGTELRI